MFKKSLKILIVLCMLVAFIPFGNFVEAKKKDDFQGKKEKNKDRVELIEERTALSKTFDNLDGTLSTEITQTPQHYQDNGGQWKEIRNDLVPDKEGKIKNRDNVFTVEFDEKLTTQSTGIQLIEDAYQINLHLAEVVNDTVEYLQPSIGEVNNNQVSYPEIFEDISAIYTIGENYIKEDIILESYPQNGLPEKFTYTLDLKGLSYEEINNTVYLYDPETKNTVYMIEAPFMYDAYQPVHFKAAEGIISVPEEAKSYDIQINTREENGQLFIDLIPNQDWLASSERQYPIVIDPMLVRIQGATEIDTAVDDTTIRSNSPTTTGGNDFELGIGTATDGNIVRSLLKFNLTSIPAAANILSADLNLHLTSTNNATTGIGISAHALTNPWKENEASWTYRDNNPYTKWSTAGGDYSFTALSTVSSITAVPTNIADGLTQWKIPLDSVKKWVSTPSSNYGVLLKSTAESTRVYKKFASSAYSTATQYKPKLVITYKTPSRLGLEDYWDYTSHPLIEGTQYVNLGTLNNVLQYQDFSLLNYANFGLDFIRTYNSKDFEKSAFGYGWTFTGDQKLFIIDKNGLDIQYKDEDGTTHAFTNPTDGKYTSPSGLYDTLFKVNPTTYTLTSPTGIITTFTVKESTTDMDVQVAYITQQKDLNNNTITYSYNSNNQLTAIYTNADTTNQKLSFTYNNVGLISKITHKDKEFNYSYTGEYLTSVTQKKSATAWTTTYFTYKDQQLTQVKDGNGLLTTFTYSSNLDISTVSENGASDSTTKYNLDRTTRQMTVTSPENMATTYSMNSNFVVIGILQPSGERTTYELDSAYNVTKETIHYTDGTIYERNYKYDVNGNVLEIRDSNNPVKTYTYNSRQAILTEKAADETLATYEYDTKNNLLSTQLSNDEKTSYTYDINGDLIKVIYPNHNSESYTPSYSNGQKTIIYKDDVLGTTSKVVIDIYGNKLSSTDGKGQQTQYQYNLKNELTGVITENPILNASKLTTSYTYDDNGNLLTSTNALGKTMLLTYTPQNQVATEKNALGKVTSYSYNRDGDLTQIKKADNTVISYKSDALNGENKVCTDLCNDKDTTTQFTTIQNGLTSTTTNHPANQVVQYISAEDGILQNIRFNNSSINQILYGYTNEKLATLQYGNQKLDYSHNTNGQLTTLKLNTATLASFTYDPNGLNTETSFGNNKSAIKRVYKGTSTQLQTEKYTTSPDNPEITNTYTYDANGQITSISNGTGTKTYTYDALNQLTQEKLEDGQIINYTYDSVGNRTSKIVSKNGNINTINYTFNDANQLTKAGSQSYTVDMNGNLTNDGRYQYVWNAFDQLTEVKGLTNAMYKYDENGRRIYSNVNNTETYYRYDGTSNRVLFEEDAIGNITKAYTYDDNGHPLTLVYKDATYYYLTNYRGDVLALIDATGAFVAKYTYDAWGNILSQKGSMASVNPYRYAGYRYDEETQLYYLMARYYNPDTGVFLSLDPVRGDTMNPITMNGYNYANNNPVMYVDPDGELPILIPFILGAMEGVLAIIARQVAKQAIKKLTPVVTNFVIKYGKSLRFTGPHRSKSNKDNHTLFTLYSNKKQLLRIDMKIKYTKWDGYTAWVHYHIQPNMSKHFDLFEIKLGKNLRRFPW